MGKKNDEEPGGDVDDLDVQPAPAPKSKLRRSDASWRKSVLLGGGMVAAAAMITVLFTVLVGRKSAPPPDPNAVAVNPGGMTEARKGATPALVEASNDYNRAGAEQAAREGSAFTPDVVPPLDPRYVDPPKTALAPAPVPADSDRNAPGPVTATPTQPESTGLSAENTRIVEQLIARWQPTGASAETRIASATASTSTTGVDEPTGPAAAPSAEAARGLPVPPAFQRVQGRTYLANVEKRVETELNPRVIVTLLHGPYEGAQLRGKASRVYESLQCDIDEMLWQGQLYKIAARCIDENTASDLLTSDVEVNRRVMGRYVWPVVLKAVEAGAEVASQRPTSAIATNGAIVATAPAAGGREVGAAAAKEGVRALREALTSEMPPKSVAIERSSTVGVFFY